jgi:site-specific recombinase XerD
MGSDLVRAPPGGLALPDVERVRSYASKSRADATRRAYAADWRAFESWALSKGMADPRSASPEAVAAYLASLATVGRPITSIERAYSGIVSVLRAADPLTWPRKIKPDVIAAVLTGVRRAHPHAPRGKAPLTAGALLDAVLSTCDDSPMGLRDRALLLVGFGAAARRSELVALNVGDVTFDDQGVRLRIMSSKTSHKPVEKAILRARKASRCPAAALEAWLGARSNLQPDDPVFTNLRGERLSARWVAETIKHRVEAAGIGDPATFGGHSLRAGFVTSAAKAGKSLDSIRRQTQHARLETLIGYIRHATAFDDNATEGLL